MVDSNSELPSIIVLTVDGTEYIEVKRTRRMGPGRDRGFVGLVLLVQ